MPILLLFCLSALLWCAPAAALDFAPCQDAGSRPALAGSLCAQATVPLAHAAADGGERLTLFVRKFPAPAPSRGSVWLVAGGPGESGASLYPFLATLRRSFPGYDLLIPDHRGTGFSSRLCPHEEAVDSPGGSALAGEEWASCLGGLAAQPDRARHFSLTNAAHDLRQLIGEEAGAGTRPRPTYLYGVSYGTQLVLRTLQLGPLPLSGVVLDSLVPPQADPRWDLSHRSQVVDAVGRRVLAACDAERACAAALGAPADAVLRRVLAKTRAEPGLLARVPGKDLRRFLGVLLDFPTLRARIPYLIRDLDAGRTAELDAVLAALPPLLDALGDYPQTPPSLPLTGVISNSEGNLRPGLARAEVEREEAGMLFTSPLPGLLAGSTLPSYPRERLFGQDPERMPPTLVLQGSLDPKTPFEGARLHAATLAERGPLHFATVDDAPHFILWTAPGNFEREVAAFVAR